MPRNMKISDLTISRSQIHDYLSCGYRWDLSYRRGIASTKIREAMDVGSAVHRGIKGAVHVYAKTKKVPKSWFVAVNKEIGLWMSEERERYGAYLTDEIKDQLVDIAHEALGIALKALEFIRLGDWEVAVWEKKPVVEREFVTVLDPWKGYRTIPDLVARRRADGKNAPWWLVDWKTRASFEEDDAEEINLQFATMQFVLEQETDLRIGGSILWQIKSQAPRKPTQNKDGKMSRAAIVTDWATYQAALEEAGLDPADYEDMREKIALVEWFRTIRQHRNSEECVAVWEHIVVPAAQRMAKDPQVIRRWNNLPFICKGCWAKDFCRAELNNDDTEFLLETDYMDTRNPREPRELGDARKTFNLGE